MCICVCVCGTAYTTGGFFSLRVDSFSDGVPLGKLLIYTVAPSSEGVWCTGRHKSTSHLSLEPVYRSIKAYLIDARNLLIVDHKIKKFMSCL